MEDVSIVGVPEFLGTPIYPGLQGRMSYFVELYNLDISKLNKTTTHLCSTNVISKFIVKLLLLLTLYIQGHLQ